MKFNWKKSRSPVKPEIIDSKSSKSVVYLRKDIKEVFDDENGLSYEYMEVKLDNKYRYNIDDIDLYIEKLVGEFKAILIKENEQKRNVEFIKTSIGNLKTSTPLGDLKVALPIYQTLVKRQGGLKENSIRLYDDEGNVFSNKALTESEFNLLLGEIIAQYIQIDARSTEYIARINNAKSIEEIEGVVIEY